MTTPDNVLTPQRLARVLQPRFVRRPAVMMVTAGISAALAEPAEPAESPFMLRLSEWIDLQVGMANLDRVALTMRNLGADLAAPAAQAESLAKLWRDTAFPALRAAAADIRDYGQRVATGMPRSMTRDQVEAILRSLGTAAGAAKTRADVVYGHVVDLERGCAALRASVTALRKVYVTRAANTTKETEMLRTELDELTKGLPERQARYHHYVTVAATTVTYAWIPLFGWIAGGAVAGTYGSAAKAEKDAIDKDVSRIAEITRTLGTQERQIAILVRATNGLESMVESFTRVLPVVQHTQGIWAAIDSDLGELSKAVLQASDPELASLLELSLEAEVAGWRDVAAKAADYLRHAEVVGKADPAPFGNFRTQVRYGNKTFDEHHVLTIDLLGVAVNGVPVTAPIFEGNRLRWGWQTDANRHDKPETAAIQFSANAFEGVCNFPMEGQIGWIGTRL
jgi:hypothetical protein